MAQKPDNRAHYQVLFPMLHNTRNSNWELWPMCVSVPLLSREGAKRGAKSLEVLKGWAGSGWMDLLRCVLPL